MIADWLQGVLLVLVSLLAQVVPSLGVALGR